MTRLVDLVSRLLEPHERDAVRGDLAESGATDWRALRDVLGLVARRQAALWNEWQPWLALVGVVGLAGVLLVQFSGFVSSSYDLNFWIIRNYRDLDPRLLEQTGLTLRHGILALAPRSFLLIAWSWTSGFALGSLSPRTIWVNSALLLCLLCVFFSGWHPRASAWATVLCRVMFLIPFVLGAYRGVRLRSIAMRPAILLTAAIVSVTALAIWTGGWWREGAWQRMQLSLSLFFVLAGRLHAGECFHFQE